MKDLSFFEPQATGTTHVYEVESNATLTKNAIRHAKFFKSVFSSYENSSCRMRSLPCRSPSRSAIAIDRQALPRNEKRLAFLTHGVIEESHLPKTIIWVFLLMVNNLQECQQSLEPCSAWVRHRRCHWLPTLFDAAWVYFLVCLP